MFPLSREKEAGSGGGPIENGGAGDAPRKLAGDAPRESAAGQPGCAGVRGLVAITRACVAASVRCTAHCGCTRCGPGRTDPSLGVGVLGIAPEGPAGLGVALSRSSRALFREFAGAEIAARVFGALARTNCDPEFVVEMTKTTAKPSPPSMSMNSGAVAAVKCIARESASESAKAIVA
jgi:hypothetical protein